MNQKGPDGNYSFCSLRDGKEGGAMRQPGTARLSSPYQHLKKESQGKGQEHHHLPPTLYWGWHGGNSPPAPQKKGHPLQTKPPCFIQAMALQKVPNRVCTPRQDSVPAWGAPAAGEAAPVTAQLSQVWRDPKQGTTQHSRDVQPCNNTATKPQAREGLRGTSASQGEGASPGQMREIGQLSRERHKCRDNL